MSLEQDQIDVTLSHYTPTPYNQCPYHVSTSYTSESSEIQPGQAFSLPNTHPPTHLDDMGENKIHTALKGCGVIK